MQFTEKPRNKFVRIADIASPETEPESDFFDPRRDLGPLELDEMKSFVLQKPIDPITNMQKAWIRWCDPAFASALDRNENLATQAMQYLHSFYGTGLSESMQTTDFIFETSSLIQFLPNKANEIRQIVDKITKPDDWIQSLRSADISYSSAWAECAIELWPAEKERIKNALVNSIYNKEWPPIQALKESSPTDSFIRTAASLCLIDPTIRSEIMSVVKQRRSEVFSVKETRKKGFNGNMYQRYVKALTILGAKDASINEQGIIEVEMYSLPNLGQITPLPPRPQV